MLRKRCQECIGDAQECCVTPHGWQKAWIQLWWIWQSGGPFATAEIIACYHARTRDANESDTLLCDRSKLQLAYARASSIWDYIIELAGCKTLARRGADFRRSACGDSSILDRLL